MANQTAPELAEEDSNLKDTYKTDRSSSVATSSNTGKDDFQNE